MNVEEYISTGILEQYALGDLQELERLAVENMCTNHPEIKAELDAIEATVLAIAQQTALSPRPTLKTEVKDRLDLNTTNGKQVQLTPASERSSFNLAVAASVSIAILTSALAFYFYYQWQSAEDQLEVLVAQNQEIADNYQFVNQRLQGLESEVEILGNPGFVRIAMNGTDRSPESLATVYWNSTSQEVYLKIQNLKALSQEEQYQLWAIVDGKPVDMGVFDLAGTLVKMKSVDTPAAFAVTIEPRGGSINPTLESMQVIGNVKV